MGEYKSLSNEEAVQKLKELAEDVKICMFCTELLQLPVAARPMNVSEVDDQGNFWFISSAKSNKNFEISHDNRVQLFFSQISNSHYLSVFGTASIYKDRAHIEEVWKPIAKAWFEDGKDDPDVTVIKVTPSDAYYWDTKDGKAVSLIKIAAAAITGDSHNDGSIEGKITL
ncbi:MAG TPA: pyridoxamine 5'-phosphate oxidase family protein [Flavobacterium sp.]|jgi:general stress protein 26